MILKQGDCLELIREIQDNSIDLIVTDPPYEIPTTKGRGSLAKRHFNDAQKDLKELGITEGFNKDILNEMWRVMKKPNIYIWCNVKQIPMYIDFFVTQKGCSMEILIWEKTNAAPTFSNKWISDKEYCLYFRKGGYCQPQSDKEAHTIFRQPMNTKDKALWEHPTCKPVNILKTIIRNSSHEGDTILDPFMGSGSTAIACQDTNRHFIGYEITPKYFNIATQRVEINKNELTLL